MNRNPTEGPKTCQQTICLDEATNETLDKLARRLGASHSQVCRLAIRNLGLQHCIPTRSVPAHPHLVETGR